jgi:nucleotide-binding universal stress UspA family protein
MLVGQASVAGAGLVVVGSRGLGPIASTVLGSVSQEVIDLAPCPVLVARSSRITRTVAGTDGSACAEAAERFYTSLPIARSVPVTMVSVAEVLGPLAPGIAPTMTGATAAAQAEAAEARQAQLRIAEEARERLRRAGLDAAACVRDGDPAAELLAEAAETAADLIVVGSRGRTGLARLALGSVARRVLHHASASVLIVRCPDERRA